MFKAPLPRRDRPGPTRSDEKAVSHGGTAPPSTCPGHRPLSFACMQPSWAWKAISLVNVCSSDTNIYLIIDEGGALMLVQRLASCVARSNFSDSSRCVFPSAGEVSAVQQQCSPLGSRHGEEAKEAAGPLWCKPLLALHMVFLCPK